MKLTHVGIWTNNIEKLKEFYITYFGATAGEKYVNPHRQFSSYFLFFQGDTSLELMNMPEIHPRPIANDDLLAGLTHIAFCLENKDAVDALTARLRNDGYEIESFPRMTGDGFYESVVLDPDKNIVEITCQP